MPVCKLTRITHGLQLPGLQQRRHRRNRQKVVDGIVSLNGRDLEITREEGVLVISYAYDRKIPLFGGVSLLIRYEGTTRKGAL